MADFKIGRVNAHVFQGADNIVNHGAVVRQTNSDGQEFINLLSALRREIGRARASGRVPEDIMEKIEAAVDVTEGEAVAPEPSSGKLVTALTHLKSLTTGLTSTAGIAEAVDRIIQTLSGAP